MMIGVTSAEAFVLLNNEEMELGLETETRNKLVSDLVTSSFHHHQKEIFSAVITEYTDWAQVARHPITTRQSSHKTLVCWHISRLLWESRGLCKIKSDTNIGRNN